MNDENGKWVTINGAHVFIREGETTEDAIAKLQERKKPEKYYRVNRGGIHITTDDTNLDKYKQDWYYQTYGDDIFEEIDISDALNYIDNMDMTKSVVKLRGGLFKETISLPRDTRDYLMRQLNNRIAEHQMTLADEFLQDCPKHTDLMLEDSLTEVNKRHYDQSKQLDPHSSEFAAYTYNCQRCAQAFVLRYCHGYDVEAKPCEREWDDKKRKFIRVGIDQELDKYAKFNGYNRLEYDFMSSYNGWERIIFNEVDVKRTLVSANGMAAELGGDYYGTRHQLRYINKTVKAAGNGATFICSVCWKGTRTNEGNYAAHVFCIVNDSGKVKFIDPQTGEECSHYFTENQIVPKETEIFRADNCRLNGTMMKEVVTYEKAD